MRRFLVLTLVLLAGCHASSARVHQAIEAQAALPPAHAAPPPPGADGPSSPTVAPAPDGPLDLPTLWGLALARNPSLREAAADVEAARGETVQAAKYPNPHLVYNQESLGTPQAAAGSISAQATQEVVTAGKRRLDVAIAGRGADAASLALLGRKFEVLTRVRRFYYDFLGWLETVRVNDEVAASLRQGVEVTRKLVEDAKTRPRSDLLTLQALLKQAEITQAANRANLDAAWRQLAAEVGAPGLAMPDAVSGLPDAAPPWDGDSVRRRVLAGHTELRQAAVEAERARLEVERARAEAVPNVTVGGGYNRNFAENEMGAVISVETALPLWDRKQGRIYQAQANWAKAQEAQRTAATRLDQEAAEAFGRFQAARRQVERLTTEVLPPLEQSLDLLRKGYEAGAAQVAFADVLTAQQTLNETRLRIAEARRALWAAAADLEGLMQLDLGEELCDVGPANGRCEPVGASSRP